MVLALRYPVVTVFVVIVLVIGATAITLWPSTSVTTLATGTTNRSARSSVTMRARTSWPGRNPASAAIDRRTSVVPVFGSICGLTK